MVEFILKTNEEDIINEKINYNINNDILRFRLNNETYKYYLKDNLFIKINKDTKITIDINNKLLIIEFMDMDQKFMNGINIIDAKIEDNFIYFKYELLDEKEIINEIYLKY